MGDFQSPSMWGVRWTSMYTFWSRWDQMRGFWNIHTQCHTGTHMFVYNYAKDKG